MSTALAHRGNILEKSVEVLSYTYNYSVLSKNLNSISWPSSFKPYEQHGKVLFCEILTDNCSGDPGVCDTREAGREGVGYALSHRYPLTQCPVVCVCLLVPPAHLHLQPRKRTKKKCRKRQQGVSKSSKTIIEEIQSSKFWEIWRIVYLQNVIRFRWKTEVKRI